jgi:hypothetical protein
MILEVLVFYLLCFVYVVLKIYGFQIVIIDKEEYEC